MGHPVKGVEYKSLKKSLQHEKQVCKCEYQTKQWIPFTGISHLHLIPDICFFYLYLFLLQVLLVNVNE